MYEAGMNVVRLNMSHATYDDALKTIGWVKTLNRKVKYPIPILLDTQGPEIRTGPVDEPLRLKNGGEVWLTTNAPSGAGPNDAPPAKATTIAVDYGGIHEALRVGDTVRLDNGLINLKVLENHAFSIRCNVMDGGVLGSRKHVNLPGVHVDLPSISRKDHQDIQFGLDNDVDYFAQSFVRSPGDVAQLRALLGPKNQSVKVIAKIENQEGADNVAAIASVADGVMVARGDLGIETDIATLPNLQRLIVRSAFESGTRSIVATHLLESMIDHPIPTRAEVTDVANAIYEGVDAVMLSGETSVGQYPVRCVEQLAAIAVASERLPDLGFSSALDTNSDKQYLARSAVDLAERIEAAGIVVITRRGLTADLVTNCAPPNVPIFAFTNNSQTRRRLMMNRGVYAHRTPFSRLPEKTLQTAFAALMTREGLKPEDRVVVISDVLAEGPVDAIQLRALDHTVQTDDP